MHQPDLIVLHEHPEWQKPLFAPLERRGIAFAPFELTRAAFNNTDAPRAKLYFNQASPSAYVRGNTRAVPLALAYMRSLERLGARVLNGADVFALELSKSAQSTLLRAMGIDTPRSITFNDASVLRLHADDIRWPAILKPDQGGSGARIRVVESMAHVERILADDPGIWWPDNLLLLQEYLPHDADQGIIRLEFLGGELLYAMRVKTHGRFNLCPSPVCNPDEDSFVCTPPERADAAPVEFYPYVDAPSDAIATARRIVRAARLDVGAVEYLETTDGRRVFYDINANSNLRPSVVAAFGFDPFECVVTYLARELEAIGAEGAERSRSVPGVCAQAPCAAASRAERATQTADQFVRHCSPMSSYTSSTYGDRIANVYDSLFTGPDPSATSLLAELAGDGPVLELGIGTGRLALPLAARGPAVHGIDASPAMVAKLRAKAGGASIPVTIGDFSDMHLDTRFALVFVAFNTLFSLVTQEQQVGCFRSVAAHLQEGGLFLVEAFVPDLSRFERGQRLATVRIDDDGEWLEASQHNAAMQHVDSHLIRLTDRGVQRFPIRIRYAWPAELDLMAQLAGLSLRHRWAGWQRQPFSSASAFHVSVYERTAVAG